MFSVKHNAAIAFTLLFAVLLWGGNNTGTKHLVASWPPITTGGSRFLCAGLLLLVILRYTNWFGASHKPSPALSRQLWWGGGLSLAVYIIAFNWALRLTSASHVALYLGASPIWALLWEGKPEKNLRSAQRYAAALLALCGVGVLFWPALQATKASLPGEALGLLAGVLWTNFGRQCRKHGQQLSGVEITAHTMWRAGVWLLPLAVWEIALKKFPVSTNLILIQLYCIIAGGVVAFGIWNNGLRQWPTSRVYLFNNLIPLSTATWAHFCLAEKIAPTFWVAMMLVAAGVALGQMNFFGKPGEVVAETETTIEL